MVWNPAHIVFMKQSPVYVLALAIGQNCMKLQALQEQCHRQSLMTAQLAEERNSVLGITSPYMSMSGQNRQPDITRSSAYGAYNPSTESRPRNLPPHSKPAKGDRSTSFLFLFFGWPMFSCVQGAVAFQRALRVQQQQQQRQQAADVCQIFCCGVLTVCRTLPQPC